MELEIEPTPTFEEERAIRAALADEPRTPQRSGWWASGFDDLRDGAALEDPGRDARVVEP